MKKFLTTVFNLLSSLVISCVNQLDTTVFSFLSSTENYTYKRICKLITSKSFKGTWISVWQSFRCV